MKLVYQKYKYLIKPLLIYTGAVMLSTSAALYAIGSEASDKVDSTFIPETSSNISIEKKKQLEILRSNLQEIKYNQDKAKSNFEKEFWCLKILGWHEIRGGSEYAMKAVYSVVENRKKSGKYPDTYCEIMKQNWQFSFWNRGKYNTKALEPKPKNEQEVIALKTIESISLSLLKGTFNPVLPSNILWYSTPEAKRNAGYMHWTNQFKVATKAGPHLFYREPRNT